MDIKITYKLNNETKISVYQNTNDEEIGGALLELISEGTKNIRVSEFK